MPDTSTCPRINNVAWKNHDSQNDPRLFARDGTIVSKQSPYVKG
ncbi:hypothetical protein E2C01_046783 [Portunus trituberculatus]|uniref:Uncharacterized protein n=1 Tax=Portunus trituberculatus TaxID=210409 RepID=A0A5B7G6L9_PORTR|nr:hypothetical protein [Portunus trituberculatus]